MSGDFELTQEATAMSKRGASKGGKARAEKLTPEERREIARRAAQARWGKGLAEAEYDGQLQIGNKIIDCAVLDDGTRVVNQTTLLAALDRAGKSLRGPAEERRPPFLSAANLQPFITDELRAMIDPIPYRSASDGKTKLGYRAEALPMVCEVYLDAREHKALAPGQRPVAAAAEVLMRGLARVGIVALVDEATGYQKVRAQEELQRILDAYVQPELRPWTRMFPPEFFEHIYRLQGWEYRPGTSKRTPYVGVLVNKYVYAQLPEGVLPALQKRNPRTDHGYRRYKHFQFLTADTGDPHLDKQITSVLTIMRISRSKQEFEALFERAFPPAQPRLPLIIDPDEYDTAQ